MSTRTMLITLLATAMTLPAVAQDSTPPAESAADQAVTVLGSEPAANTVSRDRDTLSVDFPDEDIKTILRNVADLFELNLVVPDTLTGKTSIKLRDVTWRQIFKTVLEPVNYTYVEEGNIIKVIDNATLLQEPVSTDVFIINNAKAEDLRPTIAGLVDAAVGGKVEINQRSNALIITERPSRMGRIRAIIEQLDKATAQVMIESKFIEVSDTDIRNIGVNWAGLEGMRLGVGQMEHNFSRNRGSSFENGNSSTAASTSNSSNTSGSQGQSNSTSGTTSDSTVGNTTTYVTGLADPASSVPSSFNPATGAVSGLPTSIPTVTTNANFTPATVTSPASADALNTFNGTTENGSSSSTSNSVTDTLASQLGNTAQSAVNQLMGLTSSGGTNRVTTAVFSASDFNVIVSALKSQNNAKVVSNPTVVTLNNTEAVLNIGTEFPIPSYTYNSERGTFEVSGFQYKPIGVILKVTPQVNAQGTIRLNLEPEISQRTGDSNFGGAVIPIIGTRKVKTQVSLQDGYTAGLGGLVSYNKSHGGTKVPVLGSIPGLGRLFSSKSVNDQTSNLLIFITAKTVNPDGAAPSDVFSAPALESVGMDSTSASNKN